jgi:hypothetical protein
MRLGGDYRYALSTIPALQPLTNRQTPHVNFLTRLPQRKPDTGPWTSSASKPALVRQHGVSRNPNRTMSSTRIYHNISRIPITSTLVLILGNYELWRIHKGTHPYWSPKLEAAGYTRKQQVAAPGNAAVGARVEPSSSGVSIQWMNLNGVPIPFIAPKSVD